MPRKKSTPPSEPVEQKTAVLSAGSASGEVQTPDQSTRFIAAVGYVWLLFLIPLLLKKDDFTQFHAKQGLMLFVFSFVIMILSVIPILGWIVAFFGWIAIFIFSIVGIVKSLQGEKWQLPYLGNFAQKIQI